MNVLNSLSERYKFLWHKDKAKMKFFDVLNGRKRERLNKNAVPETKEIAD